MTAHTCTTVIQSATKGGKVVKTLKRETLFILQQNDTATNWQGGDLVGWRIVRNIFGQGKPLIVTSSLDRKTLSCPCRPWDSNPWPLSVGVNT